jgi:hypothetical protein
LDIVLPQTEIEPGSLEALQGGYLFYPCAGSDWSPFIERFGDHVGEFHFCDVGYENLQDLASRSPFSHPSSYRLVTTEIEGPPVVRMQWPTKDRPYRELKPGRLRQVYERVSDGVRLTIIRRRGFGQYALGEFPNRSISVFVHRGDSPGEGGSNICFLANKDRRHEPLSHLFSKLTERLTDPARIISAGSNTSRSLQRKLRGRQRFTFGAFEWRRMDDDVDFAGGRRDPTPVWQVIRRESF